MLRRSSPQEVACALVKTPYREAADRDTAPKASYLMRASVAWPCDSDAEVRPGPTRAARLGRASAERSGDRGKFARIGRSLHVSGGLLARMSSADEVRSFGRVAEPEPERREHWEDLADHLGGAYLRYSFTKGTAQEVGFLIDVLGLRPGMRVLDVGCGPGRHSHELARRGMEVVGVDIAQRFVDLATEHVPAEAPGSASFERHDARHLPFADEFDAAISLCQGAFGLSGPQAGGPRPLALDPYNLAADQAVLEGMRQAVRPGSPIAVSAFSAYFQVRWLEDHDTFDAATGVNHESTEIRDEQGRPTTTDLWTTCSTPRELRLLFEHAHLAVDAIHSVEPGRYAPKVPSIDTPELLVLGHRSV